MSGYEAWKRKVDAASAQSTPVPVVVDMADPRAAMRAARWGGEGAPAEAPGTGVGRGSRVAEALQGDDWQERAIAEAKAAKRRKRK